MNNLAVDGFDWDDGNWPKCGKHGLSKLEIQSIFVNGPNVFVHPKHSINEQRLRAIGKNDQGRYVYVSFTIRESSGQRLVRPVSARYMHIREIKHYERQNPT